jgi:hypothetical protein
MPDRSSLPRPGHRVLASLCTLAVLASPALASEGAKAAGAPAAKARPAPLVQAVSPPFTEGLFPCSTCHDGKQLNTERRDLNFHSDPGEPGQVFAHDAENRWCLDCHDARNRDVLRSASGAPIPFTESYRLCGQCHGDKYRDWKVGVHGKRIGMWDGAKTYFLCVNCHNPHTPKWKGIKEVTVDGKKTVAPTLELLKPEPRPRRPEEMRQ